MACGIAGLSVAADSLAAVKDAWRAMIHFSGRRTRFRDRR
jgi:pyruvate-formate lyase